MKATRAEIADILRTLDQTPKALARSTSRAEAARLRLKPDARSWSALDILAHLRSCADVWGASIQSMLAEVEPSLPDIHPRKWVEQTDYAEIEFAASLRAFARQRRNLLNTLKSLPCEAWERGARIGGRRHTVFTQARRMAKHEFAGSLTGP
jgi:hypothetical protein